MSAEKRKTANPVLTLILKIPPTKQIKLLFYYISKTKTEATDIEFFSATFGPLSQTREG